MCQIFYFCMMSWWHCTSMCITFMTDQAMPKLAKFRKLQEGGGPISLIFVLRLPLHLPTTSAMQGLFDRLGIRSSKPTNKTGRKVVREVRIIIIDVLWVRCVLLEQALHRIEACVLWCSFLCSCMQSLSVENWECQKDGRSITPGARAGERGTKTSVWGNDPADTGLV